MALISKRMLCGVKSYQQGQYHGKIREYFYYISHEGFLFLDDSRMKNFTAAYKDIKFLDFFYKQLRMNETDRFTEFPYVSLCGRERNYMRCDDRPIVYTDIVKNEKDEYMFRVGGSSKTVPLQPSELCMLDNGRLYHPSHFADYGLVKSVLADRLFPLFEFDSDGYPTRITWQGKRYPITGSILELHKKSRYYYMTTRAPRKPRRSDVSMSQLAASAMNYTTDDDSPDVNEIFYCLKGGYDDVPLSRDEKELMKKAYKMIVAVGIDPEWITAESALRIGPGDPNFFLLPAFRGKVFEHLENIKVKVIGTSVVSQCLVDQRAMPRLSHPVFSLTMEGATVCFSELSIEERKRLWRLVQYMSGTATGAFIESVSHLVANTNSGGSAKYQAARQLRIPVMMTSWIDEGWKLAQQQSVCNIVSDDYVTKFRTPLFNNMVVCLSGISGRDNIESQRLIELNGGKYSGEMRRGICTHLITEQTNREKYKKASSWGTVHIVNMRWLRKCVQDGVILNEKNFHPSKPALNHSQPVAATTSTPRQETGPPEFNISSIQGTLARRGLMSSQMTAGKSDKTLNGESSAVARTPSGILNSTSRSRLLCRDTSLRRMTSSQNVVVDDPIDQVEDRVLRTEDFDFLEGHSLWLCGVDDRRLEKWKRAVDRLGATRAMSMETASHIVVVSCPAADRAALQDALMRGVVIARAQWIVACFQTRQYMNPEDYRWDAENAAPARSTSESSLRFQPDEHIDVIEKPADVVDTVTVDKPSEPAARVGDVGGQFTDTFKNLRFCFYNLTVSLVSHWKNQITSAGGRVVESSESCDFLVCDGLEYGSHPRDVAEAHFEHYVTDTWLQRCLSVNEVLDERFHCLFRPIPAVRDSDVMKDVVAVLMHLDSFEKITLSNLVKSFGGRVENSVVARGKNDILPTTHLILGCLPSRIAQVTTKAPHIKLVDPSWVVESIVNAAKEPEQNYPVKDSPFDGYVRTDDLWITASKSALTENDTIQSVALDQYDAEIEEERLMSQRELDCPSALPNQRDPTTSMEDALLNSQEIHSYNPAHFKPRFCLDGITQVLDGIPSPSVSEHNSSADFLTVSGVGRMLHVAAEKTGRGQRAKSTRGIESSQATQQRTAAPVQDSADAMPAPAITNIRRSTRRSKEKSVEVESANAACQGPSETLHCMMEELASRMQQRRVAEGVEPQPQTGPSNARPRLDPNTQPSLSEQGTSSSSNSRRWRRRPAAPSQMEGNAAKRQKTDDARIEATATVIEWNSQHSTGDHSIRVTERPHPLMPVRSAEEEIITVSSDRAPNKIIQTPSAVAGTNTNRINGTIDITSSPFVPEIITSVAESRTAGSTSTSNTAATRTTAPVVRQLSGSNTGEVSASVLRTASRGNRILPENPPNAPLDNAEPQSSGGITLASALIDETSTVQEPAEKAVVAPPVPVQRLFVFTSVPVDERTTICAQITSLGGRWLDQNDASGDVTHLIAGKMVRGTKMMGALARGLWVLTTSYITESARQGRFLEEEAFEWGNVGLVGNLSERERNMAAACRRWREARDRAQIPSTGIFTGWRCLLYASEQKAAGLEPMLRAGGAVVGVRDLLPVPLEQWKPTIALVCSTASWMKQDVGTLSAMKVKGVFSMEYLSSLLLDPNHDAGAFAHPDYKTVNTNMS